MVKGHPDYLTWAGRAGGGESVDVLYFVEEIAAESDESINFPVVEAGYEHIYQNITISCLDDAFIHVIVLYRDSDDTYMFADTFIRGGFYTLPGFSIAAGDRVIMLIANTSDSAVEFQGSLTWTKRPV